MLRWVWYEWLILYQYEHKKSHIITLYHSHIITKSNMGGPYHNIFQCVWVIKFAHHCCKMGNIATYHNKFVGPYKTLAKKVQPIYKIFQYVCDKIFSYWNHGAISSQQKFHNEKYFYCKLWNATIIFIAHI